jgi:hypothetical protein
MVLSACHQVLHLRVESPPTLHPAMEFQGVDVLHRAAAQRWTKPLVARVIVTGLTYGQSNADRTSETS